MNRKTAGLTPFTQPIFRDGFAAPIRGKAPTCRQGCIFVLKGPEPRSKTSGSKKSFRQALDLLRIRVANP